MADWENKNMAQFKTFLVAYTINSEDFFWRKIKQSFLQIRLPLEKWKNQNKFNGISNCYGMFDIESILFGMQIVYGDTIEYINVI